MTAASAENINGVPIEQIPIRGADTGIRLGRLIGFVLRGELGDPVGGYVDGEFVVYNDWRLRALQEREGLVPLPEPETLCIVDLVSW